MHDIVPRSSGGIFGEQVSRDVYRLEVTCDEPNLVGSAGLELVEILAVRLGLAT
ncbi:MAG: hypothetical protein ABSA65_18365 [Acidimicrobiales bacterium]